MTRGKVMPALDATAPSATGMLFHSAAGTASQHLMTAYYTRSRAAKEYRSAGVLPFALSGGGACEVLALLGGEPTHTGPGGRHQAMMFRGK